MHIRAYFLRMDAKGKGKYAHRHNAILGIIKAHYNIVKTRPSLVNCGNINTMAMGPTHARPVQRFHHHEFIILFISSSAYILWCLFYLLTRPCNFQNKVFYSFFYDK